MIQVFVQKCLLITFTPVTIQVADETGESLVGIVTEGPIQDTSNMFNVTSDITAMGKIKVM